MNIMDEPYIYPSCQSVGIIPGRKIKDNYSTYGGGYPNSWMLYFMENPKITWMTWGSPPAIRKPPIPSGKLT
jgi:hypothetical protein